MLTVFKGTTKEFEKNQNVIKEMKGFHKEFVWFDCNWSPLSKYWDRDGDFSSFMKSLDNLEAAVSKLKHKDYFFRASKIHGVLTIDIYEIRNIIFTEKRNLAFHIECRNDQIAKLWRERAKVQPKTTGELILWIVEYFLSNKNAEEIKNNLKNRYVNVAKCYYQETW